MCGDREVAKALWDWFDAKNINGYANTDYFGFVDLSDAGVTFVITMNNKEIEVTRGNKKNFVF